MPCKYEIKNTRSIMNHRLLVLLLALYTSYALSGQGGSITGQLLDGSTDEPLGFANVSILQPKDSTVITGGVTDMDGRYEIAVKPGTYLVRYDFVSYQPEYKADVVVRAGTTKDLGISSLQTSAEILQEVEVRAEKSQLEMRMDKKVFNVGKDLASTSGSAQEVLDNIPSVTVDVDGSVALRGNAGVRILINGKPSGLVGTGDANGLRSLPANLIERVEVITNPSARYEAEGMVGVINIILKKDRRQGLNGAFDVNAGWPRELGAAVNLNYRTDKLNWFTNFGVRNRRRPGENYAYQEFYNGDTTNIVEQIGERESTGWSYSARGGAEYFFSESSILTASVTWQTGNEENSSTRQYFDYFQVYPDNLIRTSIRDELEIEDENDLEYQINYQKNFNDDDDHQWTTVLQYRNNRDIEDSEYNEVFRGPNGNPNGEEDLLQLSLNDEWEREWLLQSDFTLPVGEEGLFESGFRGSIRYIDNDFEVEEFVDDAFVTLPGLTNDFNYDENIYAVYAMFGDKPGRFSYQVGLRLESTNIFTQLRTTGEENEQNYLNLFPTTHLTYDINDGNSIQLSYSRRIQRPRFWWLNPFYSFADARNIRQGNPNLRPEFTDSYELGHIKYWDNFSLSTSAYYRYTTNVVQRIQRLEEQDGQLITISQPENLATEDAYGFEFIFSGDPFKWLNINANMNFFRSIIDGSNIEQNLDQDTYAWFGRLNSRFELGEKTNAQFRFNYEGPRETTQGRRESISSIDLAMSYDLWQDKATLTLSARDIFNSRLRRSEVSDPTFYSYQESQWRRRQSVVLTLNYRLNQDQGRNGGGSQRSQ